jgi:hypothetical protein
LRRVNISNVIAYNADSRYASIIAGLPERDIEDVTLNNIRIIYRGGGKQAQADAQPPERETNYPEPSMFGDIPAAGFFLRHAQGVTLSNIELSYLDKDMRPAFVLDDVKSVIFNHVTSPRTNDISTFALKNVLDFSARECSGVTNVHLDRVDQKRF